MNPPLEYFFLFYQSTQHFSTRQCERNFMCSKTYSLASRSLGFSVHELPLWRQHHHNASGPNRVEKQSQELLLY